MLLTLKTMLVLASIETLPDNQRVHALARRLSSEMTRDQVFERLRLQDHLSLWSGSLHSVSYFTPLREQNELVLHFVFVWKGADKESPLLLRGLTLRDKDRKRSIDLKYEPKK